MVWFDPEELMVSNCGAEDFFFFLFQKTLKSPLNDKEDKPVNMKGNQS